MQLFFGGISPRLSRHKQVFCCFFLFGLLNNILYVVILSAAIDLVGSSTPKGIVLLADISPALVVKASAPFYIHHIPYSLRLWALICLSSAGMLLISLSPSAASHVKVTGIALASLSSGLGELTFLQLTHFFPHNAAIGGFSSGTGGAGLVGSFVFLLMTNILAVPVWFVLLGFAVVPWAFALVYFKFLPPRDTKFTLLGRQSDQISSLNENYEDEDTSTQLNEESNPRLLETNTPTSVFTPQPHPLAWKRLQSTIVVTIEKIRPLFSKFMVPLGSVYLSEYTINQGISPTVLFPLTDLPSWLFSSYRDIYVVYGFLYQLGVFILRTSNLFGVRVHNLYMLAALQFINLSIFLMQSLTDKPFGSIYFVLLLVVYEGLLGGLSYVNTFLSVSESVSPDMREFSMGCVSMSDSFGVVLAGCINWWLEPVLCSMQVGRGRNWCRVAPPKA